MVSRSGAGWGSRRRSNDLRVVGWRRESQKRSPVRCGNERDDFRLDSERKRGARDDGFVVGASGAHDRHVRRAIVLALFLESKAFRTAAFAGFHAAKAFVLGL